MPLYVGRVSFLVDQAFEPQTIVFVFVTFALRGLSG